MGYVLLATLTLIYAATATIDIEFLRGLPRLNASEYYDYYFGCSGIGRMLQWEVNDTTLGSFLGGTSTRVLSGNSTYFRYAASLIASNQTGGEQFSFNSVLIVSCQGQCYLEVYCRTNETSLANTSNLNIKGMVLDERGIGSLFLQYLLSDDIFTADNSRHLNIFICGVDNFFSVWNLTGSNINIEVAFTEGDNIGEEREQLQDGHPPVKHLAVLFGKEPYRLVTALFVLDASELTVTCKFSQTNLSFTIESASTMENIPPNTSENLGLPEMNAAVQTENISSMMEITPTEDITELNVAPVVVVGAVLAFFLIVAISIIIIMLVVKVFIPWNQQREKRERMPPTFFLESGNFNEAQPDNLQNQQIDESTIQISEPDQHEMISTPCTSLRNGTEEGIHESDSSNIEELTEKDFQIKNLKLLQNEQDRRGVCENAKYIISVVNKNVFYVATNISTTPNEGDVYAGTIGNHTVGLVYNSDGDECLEELTNAINTYFRGAKYIIVVGLCFALGSEKISCANVLISKKILILKVKTEKNEAYITSRQLLVNNKLKQIFCAKPQEFEGIVVEKGRRAEHMVGSMASGPDLYRRKDLKYLALGANCIGGENVVEKIESLQKKGKSIIAIKAVIQPDEEKGKQWQDIGAKAAMYYVIKKITNYKETVEVDNETPTLSVVPKEGRISSIRQKLSLRNRAQDRNSAKIGSKETIKYDTSASLPTVLDDETKEEIPRESEYLPVDMHASLPAYVNPHQELKVLSSPMPSIKE